MQTVITSLTSGVPTLLVEVRRLGRTLTQTAADILAFFDHPGTSNTPTEAVNGHLENTYADPLRTSGTSRTTPPAHR